MLKGVSLALSPNIIPKRKREAEMRKFCSQTMPNSLDSWLFGHGNCGLAIKYQWAYLAAMGPMNGRRPLAIQVLHSTDRLFALLPATIELATRPKVCSGAVSLSLWRASKSLMEIGGSKAPKKAAALENRRNPFNCNSFVCVEISHSRLANGSKTLPAKPSATHTHTHSLPICDRDHCTGAQFGPFLSCPQMSADRRTV